MKNETPMSEFNRKMRDKLDSLDSIFAMLEQTAKAQDNQEALDEVKKSVDVVTGKKAIAFSSAQILSCCMYEMFPEDHPFSRMAKDDLERNDLMGSISFILVAAAMSYANFSDYLAECLSDDSENDGVDKEKATELLRIHSGTMADSIKACQEFTEVT